MKTVRETTSSFELFPDQLVAAADTKQGHIHVPVLDGDASGEPLADMRADIVAQTLDLVAAAATS